MTGSVPKAAGKACEKLVEGGAAAYPCSREAGHTGVPPEDPEPCYAVEVPRSGRTWWAWWRRQSASQPEPVFRSLGRAGLDEQLPKISEVPIPADRPTLPELVEAGLWLAGRALVESREQLVEVAGQALGAEGWPTKAQAAEIVVDALLRHLAGPR